MDESNTKYEAQSKGNVLIAKLGKDWTLKVFENIGWHYTAFYKEKILHVHGGAGGYFAMLSDNDEHYNTSSVIWGTSDNFPDPRDAVKQLLERARQKVNHLNSIVTRAETSDIWEMETIRIYKD